MELSFLKFERGTPAFSALWASRWATMRQWWENPPVRTLRVQAGVFDDPFEDVMRRFFDLEPVFESMYVEACRVGATSPDEFRIDNERLQRIWATFRQGFTPPLAALKSQRFPTDALQELWRQARVTFLRMKRVGVPGTATDVTGGLSYACFTDQEIDYLLTNHRRIVEAGTGGGYFLDRFQQLGGDAIGYDSNLRGLTIDERGQPPEWTTRVLENGSLRIGDAAEVAAHPDRTLAIFYGEPGTDMTHRALTAYRSVGGAQFVWKPGGCMGLRRDKRGRKIVEPDRSHNAELLALELGLHWTHVTGPDALPWSWELANDCLLTFRRKEKTL